MNWTGELVEILTASKEGAPIESRSEALAVAGVGLEGDRYAAGVGTFSKGDAGRQVTLVAVEALDELEREHGLRVTPAETRRNLATRGVPLNDLVGQTFRVGGAVLVGVRLCEPCGYLEETTGKPLKTAAMGRMGLRADIVEGGPIRLGDRIEPAGSR
jgi:MOSC domain-containing protein YiiM